MRYQDVLFVEMGSFEAYYLIILIHNRGQSMNRHHVLTIAAVACSTLFLFSGCASFQPIEDENVFVDVLDKAAGVEEDETISEKNAKISGGRTEYLIAYDDGDIVLTYIRFNDKDDAMTYFTEFYKDFEDAIENRDFDGNNLRSVSRTRGYIVFDGELGDGRELSVFNAGDMYKTYFAEDTELYGGIYVNKNVYIEAYSVDGSKRDKEKIANVLKQLDFPKP